MSFKVLVLPVSGGAFYIQLAIMLMLCDKGYVPDIILGSSGGNVVAYLSLGAKWNKYPLLRMARKLKSTFFCREWSSVNIINIIKSYYTGSLFDQGDTEAVKSFFREHFTERLITDVEIWTGVYDRQLKKSQLFCNRESYSVLHRT